MTIAALGSLPGIKPLANLDVGSLPGTGGVQGIGGTGSTQKFGDAVSSALDDITQKQNRADAMSQQAATGRLQDVHEFTIATTEATLATELTVAVRNKAVEAYNEIMHMGI